MRASAPAQVVVKCRTVNRSLPLAPEFQHVVEALRSLGFTITTTSVDMVGYTDKFYSIAETEVTLGDASTLCILELAEKFSVFSSVPVSSGLDCVLFTIEDMW